MTAPGRKLIFDYYGNIETCLKFPRNEYDVVAGAGYSEFMSALKDPEILGYDVVLLDNLTGMNRDFVKEVQSSSMMGKHIGELPNQGDYSLAAERIRLVVTTLHNMARDGKCHVIMLAHELAREVKDTEGNVSSSICGPSVPGQVPAHILSMTAELIYLTSDANGDRYAHLMKRGQWPAATRLLDAGKAIKNPNLKTMYEKYW